MPYDGSGNYTPPSAPTFPAVAGETIQAARFNAIINDLSSALSQVLVRNGQAAMTGDLSLGGNLITDLDDGTVATDAATFGQLAAVSTALAAAGGADLVGERSVAQLIASTDASQGTGSLWHAGPYRYLEAAPAATDNDEVTAGGVKLYAVPTNGCFETDQFTGGIGARFNKAIAACKRFRTSSVFLVWFPEAPTILINPGVYTFDTQLLVNSFANVKIIANGVLINSFTSATTPLKLVASPRVWIEGLMLNMRGNNAADEGILIAGQCSWTTLKRVSVTANSSNTNFAACRLKQGDASGFDDNDRDKGNFWVTLDEFWARKLTGADPNLIQTGIDLQGSQNAFRLLNGSLIGVGTGLLVRNQNSSLLSGITNDLQVHYTAFEGFVDGVSFQTTDLADNLAGGAAIGCRFESGSGSAFASNFTTVSQPFQLFGNTVISNVTNYTTDASTNKVAFASLDASTTPAWVEARHISSRGIFIGSLAAGYGSVRALSKAASSGGAVILERADGTVDGKLSQRSGGGLDIDGGAANRVRIVGVQGLSGSTTTHAANFRGSVVLLSGTTTIAVTLTAEADALYGIALDVPYNTAFWVSGKTTTGFTINVATAPGADQTIRWMLWR